MTITILGIRHHGVGSATHVLRRLQEIQPDMIMIEGPPEITDFHHLKFQFIISTFLLPYLLDNT